MKVDQFEIFFFSENSDLVTAGNNCFAWIGPEPRIFIMEPELITEIVTNNNIFKKPKPAPLVKLLVSGIASYEDQKWAKHRKILNTAFYTEKLKVN